MSPRCGMLKEQVSPSLTIDRLHYPTDFALVQFTIFLWKLVKIPTDHFQRIAFGINLGRSRTPMRRNSGIGGHHPCTACCSRNPATIAGSTNNRRSTNAPSPSPSKAMEAALASSNRSTSHSRSSSSSRRLTWFLPFPQNARCCARSAGGYVH